MFFRGSSVKTDAGGSKVSEERRLNSTTKTKRDLGQEAYDLGIFEGVSSRSKLGTRYRKYVGLYREGRRCTDQVTPTLIEGTRQRRIGKNMIEVMSKRNYVIGAREPIGGDRSPR